METHSYTTFDKIKDRQMKDIYQKQRVKVVWFTLAKFRRPGIALIGNRLPIY